MDLATMGSLVGTVGLIYISKKYGIFCWNVLKYN